VALHEHIHASPSITTSSFLKIVPQFFLISTDEEESCQPTKHANKNKNLVYTKRTKKFKNL